MSLRDADRGQSIQIGAVLLFGVLVILLASYQAIIVPDQNRQVEANHAEAVAQDFQELRDAIVSTHRSGADTAVAIQLGTTYPGRAFAINPPAPTGSLRTVGTTDDAVTASVENAIATDGSVSRYWNGTTQPYSTGALVYEPDYNEYADPPTMVYENSLLYHRFGDRTLTRSDQGLVDGRHLSLVALSGTLDTSASSAVSVDLQAKSASTRQITVTNQSDGPLELAVPSQFGADRWKAHLVDHGQWENQSGGHVQAVTSSAIAGSQFDLVWLQMEPNVTYELGLANVGVGTGVEGTDAAYITAVGGQSVEPGESFTAEVRDRYNNPVSGVTVEPTGCDLDDQTTDARGQVTYQCDASGSVDLEIDDGAQAWERLTFGAGASPDTQAPTVDTGATSASAETETICQESSIFGCSDELDLSQVTLEYDVGDSGSGLDYVSLALRDDGDTVVTETSHDLGGTDQREGTWTTPWTEVDEDDVEDYDVRVRAVDEAGKEAICVADVGAGSCQLQGGSGPSFQTLEAAVTNSRGGSGTEATEVTFTYEPTATAPGVDLTVEDDLDRSSQSTGPGSTSEHEEAVGLTGTGSGPPSSNYPLDVTADVSGGTCRTATISSSGETPTLADGDWTAC